MSDLTHENYFDFDQSRRYMSASQYKAFSRCEAAALAEINGEYSRPKTSALIQGGFLDAYISDTVPEFTERHPEMFSSRGETKGQLKSEYRDLWRLIDRWEQDQVFIDYLQGDKQVIIEGFIGTVEWKGMIDILHEDRIVDFKTVRDFSDIWDPSRQERVHFAEYWGWIDQLAIYRALYQRTTGAYLDCFLAVVTKEPSPDIAVLSVPKEKLDVRIDEINYQAHRFNQIKLGEIVPDRCGRCDYCKSTKVLTGPIPYWEVSK